MPPKRAPKQPDYSLLTLAQLQKQVTKYGFKLSNERSVLISQLERCWAALHPVGNPEPETSSPAGAVEKAPKSPTKSKAAATKAAKAPPKTAEDKEEDERVAKERLVELIRADGELYMKVLRYEVSLRARAQASEWRARMLMEALTRRSPSRSSRSSCSPRPRASS